jgi:hypothetical protein
VIFRFAVEGVAVGAATGSCGLTAGATAMAATRGGAVGFGFFFAASAFFSASFEWELMARSIQRDCRGRNTPTRSPFLKMAREGPDVSRVVGEPARRVDRSARISRMP